MKIYVGNLPHALTEQELHDLFITFGGIKAATIIKDKFSGASRGFGFVEMEEKEAAQAAISSLDGKDVMGRKLRVSEAQPRPERPSRPFNSNGGGSRGGFGGSNGGGRSSFGGNRSGGMRNSNW